MILKVFLSVVVILMADGKMAVSSKEIVYDSEAQCLLDAEERTIELKKLPTIKEAHAICLPIYNTSYL